MKRKPLSKAQHQSTTSIQVVWRSTADLKLDPRSPRTHPPRQIRQIARSIETFGFNVPLLVDSSGKVIAGHGRLKACQSLNSKEVPTIVLDHLTEAQARAFMIADNRLTENSLWDDALLAEQLKELSEHDLEFSLDVTGFEMGEIDLRIEGLAALDGASEDGADDLPQPTAGPTISRPGDLWLLNEHRVYCGSALDASAYAAVMNNEQANMVFTDPPYNVPIEGNVSGLGSVHHAEFAMASGEMSEPEFTRFLGNACALLIRNSCAGALHYICMDWRHMGELLTAGRASYTELKNLCVWAKDNAGMGSFYRSQHELVFVFKNGREGHRNNIQLGQYGRNRTNVWNYPGVNSFSRSGDEGNLLALHPTVKPVALIADAIVDCTARRDLVLDGFLGSGSTLIAAQRTGRRCYGLELEPKYVDAIVRRWQVFTRNPALHGTTSVTFDNRAAEAEVQWNSNREITTTK